MNVFGLGPTEIIIIIAVVLGCNVFPVVGAYLISKRIGFSGGVSVLWSLGALFLGSVILFILGIVPWPSEPSLKDAPVPAQG